MMFRTHISSSLAIATSMVAVGLLSPNFGFSNYLNFVLFLSIIFIGSLLPDLDHSKSFISKRLGFSLPIKHRGFTHTFYIWFFLIFLGVYYNSFITEIGFYLGIGGLLHIFGDAHTKGGVRF